jgi:hypothetical protein
MASRDAVAPHEPASGFEKEARMRCIIVNGAQLKTAMRCTHCGKKIGHTYLREIGNRLIYCDLTCYSLAVEGAPVRLVRRTWPRRVAHDVAN